MEPRLAGIGFPSAIVQVSRMRLGSEVTLGSPKKFEDAMTQ